MRKPSLLMLVISGLLCFTILSVNMPDVDQNRRAKEPDFNEVIGVMEWVATFSTSDSINNIASAIDINGNIYVVGVSQNIATSVDIVTIKYSMDGDTLWARTFDGPANSVDVGTKIRVDTNCNVFVTGSSIGIGTGFDFVTIKYDSTGTLMWASRFNDPANGSDFARDMEIDANGNVYVTGLAAGPTTPKIATVKYSANGVQQWAVTDKSGELRAIAVSLVGNVYVTGSTGGVKDFLTIKYSTNGLEQWTQTLNGSASSDDDAVAIAIDATENVFVAGGSIGVGTGADFTTLKYSASGILQWVQILDGPGGGFDRINAIALDDKANVYVTGPSQGAGTDFDYATIKYDNAGNLKWQQRFNGSGNGNDVPNAIAVDNSGGIYVTGSSANTANDDCVTLKYSSMDGLQKWKTVFDGSNDDFAEDIAVDDWGNVYVTGSSVIFPPPPGTNVFLTVKYKQEGVPKFRGKDVFLKDGRLIFKDRETFEFILAHLSKLDDATLDAFENQLEFFSFRRFFATLDSVSSDSTTFEPIEDEEFATVLSPEGIIQIGKRIIKIDPLVDSAYVISNGDETLIPLLNQKKGITRKVAAVGSLDNFAYSVMSNSPITVEKQYERFLKKEREKCARDKGIGINILANERFVDYQAPPNTPDPNGFPLIKYKAKYKVKYERYAIYFTLKSKCAFWRRTSADSRYKVSETTITLDYIDFHKRKGKKQAPVNDAAFISTFGHKLKKLHYEGTRCLSRYRLQSLFDVQNRFPPFVFAGGFQLLEIKQGV